MIANDVTLHDGVVVHHPDLVNLYGCTIGSGTRIGTFVEIQKNTTIGRNCKISSHSFLCEGVTLEDGVFIGHGVMFTNDLYPRAINADGGRQSEGDWTVVRRGSNNGSPSAAMRPFSQVSRLAKAPRSVLAPW